MVIGKLISTALKVAGYDAEPTAENLIQCFKDYVDGGAWSNLHFESGQVFWDNGEVVDSVVQMAKALIGLGG